MLQSRQAKQITYLISSKTLYTAQKNYDVKVYHNDALIIHYPLAEGAGLVAYDASGNDNHGTITATEVAFWANNQDLYHYNLLNGFDRFDDLLASTKFVTLDSIIALNDFDIVVDVYLQLATTSYLFGSSSNVNLIRLVNTSSMSNTIRERLGYRRVIFSAVFIQVS